MANPIFADPFGSLLQGIRAGEQDNLNESRLAADIQAEQNRVRSQNLDRALRAELAQSEQAFQIASQQAQFANRRALAQDQNQFTLGLEGQRELLALQRERRQQEFTLARDASQTDSTIRVATVQSQLRVGEQAQQNQFTAGQNDANRVQQRELAIAQLEARAREGGLDRAQQVTLANLRSEQAQALQQGQQAFQGGQNAANRAAQVASDIRRIEATAAQGAATREQQVTLANLRAEQAQALQQGQIAGQERLVGLRADANLDLARQTAAIVPAVNPDQITADQQRAAISARTAFLDADGNFVPVPPAAPGAGAGLASFAAAPGVPAAPATLAGFAATPPVGVPPSAALPAPVTPAPTSTTGGLDIGAPAAVLGSVATRLRSGQPIPNVPGVRAEVEAIASAPATTQAERRAKRRAEAWLRSR